MAKLRQTKTRAAKKSTRQRPPATTRRGVEVIKGAITRDTTLGRGKTWVIAGEVRVAVGVALKVADGSSSRIEIRRSLVLEVPKSRDADRNLFDLETDAGASYVEPPKGCWVRVRGVFGDQLQLTADTLVHSLTAD